MLQAQKDEVYRLWLQARYEQPLNKTPLPSRFLNHGGFLQIFYKDLYGYFFVEDTATKEGLSSQLYLRWKKLEESGYVLENQRIGNILYQPIKAELKRVSYALFADQHNIEPCIRLQDLLPEIINTKTFNLLAKRTAIKWAGLSYGKFNQWLETRNNVKAFHILLRMDGQAENYNLYLSRLLWLDNWLPENPCQYKSQETALTPINCPSWEYEFNRYILELAYDFTKAQALMNSSKTVVMQLERRSV